MPGNYARNKSGRPERASPVIPFSLPSSRECHCREIIIDWGYPREVPAYGKFVPRSTLFPRFRELCYATCIRGSARLSMEKRKG